MKLTIDTEAKTVVYEGHDGSETMPLYSDRAFDLIADQWVKVGWNQKYSYTFSWMGRPIIQLPEDMVRTQEVIHRVQPDVIIETGVAHGDPWSTTHPSAKFWDADGSLELILKYGLTIDRRSKPIRWLALSR